MLALEGNPGAPDTGGGRGNGMRDGADTRLGETSPLLVDEGGLFLELRASRVLLIMADCRFRLSTICDGVEGTDKFGRNSNPLVRGFEELDSPSESCLPMGGGNGDTFGILLLGISTECWGVEDCEEDGCCCPGTGELDC